MAKKTFEELKQLAIQIRDEKTNKQNTATRIGTQMLEHLDKLEQDYYDKTATDEELKERDEKLIELEANFSNAKKASVGKNLFNKNEVTKGYFLSSGGNLSENNNFYISNFIEIQPNTQYYISGTNVGGALHIYYDSEAKFLGSTKDGATTSPENAAYIRLSIGSSSALDTAQMELGSSATAYEPYTDNFENEQEFKKQQNEIDDINNDIIELENKLPKVVVGKNLFNPDKVVNGFLGTSGNISNNDNYVTSDFIEVEGGKKITAYPLGAGPIQFCQYNSDKTLITYTQNKQPLTITLENNTKYIRATFLASNYATEGQIEYGDKVTEYEHFHYIISEESLPDKIENSVTSEDVKQIINDEVFYPKIILPSKLFFKVGRQNNLYYKQAIKCPSYDNFDFSVSNTTSGLKVFDRQLSGNPVLASSSVNKLTLRKFGKLLQELEVTINTIKSPDSAKTISILDSGDSISDLGGWQVALKKLLEADNVAVNYVGTMINRVNIGSEYAEDIWGEVQSGGNMSFITEANGAAKILTVSGITELPQTGYPGTSYNDQNGNDWVVRGFKLTKGEDGKYSGKLKLGKFKSDPNYGDGTSDDTSSTENFPSSGTITKSNSYPGDDSILYSSFDNARYNPFWNPDTDELDFQYYFDYWGFEVPDIFIMQWAYNEVQSYEECNSERVQTAKTRAQQIVDKYHSQCPNSKIIFGIEIYGREVVQYGGAYSNNSDSKKYSVLSLAEELISLFDNNAYKDFVTLVPVYALMDHIYGYGNLTDVALCDLYSECKTTVGANGKDGVHPPYNRGLSEIGRAYEPVVLSLL